MSEETKRLAAERDERMREKGYVSVAAAAALVSMPRSNIYHWVATGELRQERWGTVGRNSVYVSLADLQKKVPQAFAGAPVKAKNKGPGAIAAPAPRPLRRDRKKRDAA